MCIPNKRGISLKEVVQVYSRCISLWDVEYSHTVTIVTSLGRPGLSMESRFFSASSHPTPPLPLHQN